jgi:hypothetical protein
VTSTSEVDNRNRPPHDRAPQDQAPLVSDVQRFGLLSAAGVVSRYAAIVDRTLGTGTSPVATPRRPGIGPDVLVEGVPRLAGAVLRLLDEATALAVQATTTGSPAAPEQLDLPAATPGATSQVSVWLHNPTPAPVAARVQVTCLVSGDGAVLPVEALTCEPAGDAPLASAGAREVLLRVSVPVTQPLGRYHGLVVAPAAPDPMRLTLNVIDGGTEAS